MEYYVYHHDFNKRTIEKWNIFNHGRFTEDVRRLLNKDLTKEEFSEDLKHKMRYYFWSKCEWETIITSWPCYIDKKELDRLSFEYEDFNQKYGRYPRKINVAPDVGDKVDVFDQVTMNWNIFVDYVWNHKK